MEQNSFTNTTRKSSVGPVVGTIIIIALLAFGALYFWGERLNRGTDSVPYILDDEYVVAPEAEGWMPASSPSDEAAAIEQELNEFNLGTLESEVGSDLDAVGAGL